MREVSPEAGRGGQSLDVTSYWLPVTVSLCVLVWICGSAARVSIGPMEAVHVVACAVLCCAVG